MPRALELLLQYRNRSKQGRAEEDRQLQQSLDRVITVFQSQLFNALLGENTCPSWSVCLFLCL
uniref:L27-1 domain-containing protein n=1 Tax=Myripristis murdjan TaxID=586833 RepID=A0A668AAB4_9TELE